jgi:hypothetical protein
MRACAGIHIVVYDEKSLKMNKNEQKVQAFSNRFTQHLRHFIKNVSRAHAHLLTCRSKFEK